jgi:YggT family protein
MSILGLIDLFFRALLLIVFAGVVLSWVEVGMRGARWLYHPAINLIRELSFQITRPFRNFMDRIGLRTGIIDFSPAIAMVAIILAERIVIGILVNIGIS